MENQGACRISRSRSANRIESGQLIVRCLLERATLLWILICAILRGFENESRRPSTDEIDTDKAGLKQTNGTKAGPDIRAVRDPGAYTRRYGR